MPFASGEVSVRGRRPGCVLGFSRVAPPPTAGRDASRAQEGERAFFWTNVEGTVNADGSAGASVLGFAPKWDSQWKEGWREDGCPVLALGMWYPDLEPRPLCYLRPDWSLIQCPAC